MHSANDWLVMTSAGQTGARRPGELINLSPSDLSAPSSLLCKHFNDAEKTFGGLVKAIFSVEI